MDLDELRDLIETLQQRIEKHGSALQASEALTRYALIDPLLRTLGWDTGDPSRVGIEYPVRTATGVAKADYALFGSDPQPVMIIEAKSLRSPLQEAEFQALNYCHRLDTPYFVSTDGEHWRLFDKERSTMINKMLIVRLNLKEPVIETCAKALALWRPSVANGNILVGTTPVVDIPEPNGPEEDDRNSDPDPLPPEGGWHKLSDLKPDKGTKPVEMKFPTGRTIPVKSWADVIAETVRWLLAEGKFSQAAIPVSLPTSRTKLLVAEQPNHKNGRKFHSSRWINPYYIDTSYKGSQQTKNAAYIIQQVGLNPGDFAVRMAEQ